MLARIDARLPAWCAMDRGGTNDMGPGRPLEPPRAPDRVVEPLLPPSEPKLPEPLDPHGAASSSAWYRTDQQRYKSVYRRANPWYRRVARGVIGVSLVVIVGAGLYVGAQAVQDYLDRDRLPSPGTEATAFDSTSFLVTSSAPAPAVDGTFTIDVPTGAFEFVGGGSGPQAGIEITSPDGSTTYVQRNGAGWQAESSGDPAVEAALRVVPYLLGVEDVDDVLDADIRKGYVTLVDQTTEGIDPDARERYEMSIDSEEFGFDYPLQWDAFRDEVVPEAVESAALPLTMWIDDGDVVVRLRDTETHWAWERLDYSTERFTPEDPG
jgi:hypothetical protein